MATRILARSYLRFLAWPTLVGLAIRFSILAITYRDFLAPGRDHWEFGYELGKIAASIVNGHGFANPYWSQTGPTALLTPVYPVILSLVFRLFGVYSSSSALVFGGLNCIFSTITCIPIFFIAKRNFGVQVAALAVWLWALHPYAINFSTTTMWYHSFLALLLTLLFWIGLLLQASDYWVSWLCFGLLWGFTALVNPVVLGTMPFLLGWTSRQLARSQKHWKEPLIVGIVGMVVVIAPWLIRNDLTFHKPVFLKDGFWMEACVGNAGNTLHWWNGECQPSGTKTSKARDEFARVGELAFMNNRRRQTLTTIEARPDLFVIRSLRRVLFCWTGYWSLDPRYLREEPLDPENMFFLSSVSLLSLSGLRILIVRNRTLAISYIIVLVIFPLVYYITHLDPGFRHPLDPFMTILAAATLSRWRRLRSFVSSWTK